VIAMESAGLAEIVWQFVQNNWALLSIAATVVMLIGIPALVVGRYVRIIHNIMKTTSAAVVEWGLGTSRRSKVKWSTSGPSTVLPYVGGWFAVTATGRARA